MADELMGGGKFAPGYERTYWEGCTHGFATKGDLVRHKLVWTPPLIEAIHRAIQKSPQGKRVLSRLLFSSSRSIYKRLVRTLRRVQNVRLLSSEPSLNSTLESVLILLDTLNVGSYQVIMHMPSPCSDPGCQTRKTSPYLPRSSASGCK